VVTHVEEGRVSWDQVRFPSQESEVSALPNFWVRLCLWLHPRTQNSQIRHGKMVTHIWGAACFRSSATPLYLHKCMARFVSDSWVSWFFHRGPQPQQAVCHFYSVRSISVRLLDGPSLREGRLEVYHNNRWGAVCVGVINEEEAGVVCYMLGYG